jgi:hypothetical protein
MSSIVNLERPGAVHAPAPCAEVVPANLQMTNVEATFAAVNVQGIRQYYECADPPTQLTGLPESHFKGVAEFGNKRLFTHTDLDPVTPASNGRLLVGNVITSGIQGSIDVDFHTQHSGWCHPCGIQACGSFMAMGIQATASGTGVQSEIQILDIRPVLLDQPPVLIGTIDRANDGINGVAMTKEAGANGRYLVAGVNGTTLTVYRSAGSSLLPPASASFAPIFEDTAFPDSGAGLALITQADGGIFLVSMNADDDGGNSLVGLYRLELDASPPTCSRLAQKAMQVPGISASITQLQEYVAKLPIVGRMLSALLALLVGTLNSSFRWGKGLSITSPDCFEIYATDRNVLPLSKIHAIGSIKDFSLVLWTGRNER